MPTYLYNGYMVIIRRTKGDRSLVRYYNGREEWVQTNLLR